jgi:hypothetical protein
MTKIKHTKTPVAPWSFLNLAGPGMIRSSVLRGPPSGTTRQLQQRGSPPPSGSPDDTAPADMSTITTFGTTPALDSLRLPDGRRVGDVPRGEIYSILGGLGIDGFDHHNGLTTNIAAYARHLEKIAGAAGTAAIAAWMAEKRSA